MAIHATKVNKFLVGPELGDDTSISSLASLGNIFTDFANLLEVVLHTVIPAGSKRLNPTIFIPSAKKRLRHKTHIILVG